MGAGIRSGAAQPEGHQRLLANGAGFLHREHFDQRARQCGRRRLDRPLFGAMRRKRLDERAISDFGECQWGIPFHRDSNFGRVGFFRRNRFDVDERRQGAHRNGNRIRAGKIKLRRRINAPLTKKRTVPSSRVQSHSINRPRDEPRSGLPGLGLHRPPEHAAISPRRKRCARRRRPRAPADRNNCRRRHGS